MQMAVAVSLSRGVMNPLIGKLSTLMGNEYKKLKGVRKQASFLMHELSAMNAVLEKLELLDELEPDTRNWRDDVREMAYDMEDCIDDFMGNLGGADDKAGFIKTTIQRLKTLGARHRIAHQIEYLKTLAIEANQRRMRYKIDDCKPSSGFVAVDPRVSVIYKEAAGLVGIDGPKEELVSWLIDTEKKLKVVSIVGFGGLGKTTLAKQVFDGIGERFECKAFLSVSQRPDMTRLLDGLQLKLGMKKKEEESYHARELQDIIDELRGYLKDKRYLVVVDDVWDKQTWEIIRCAFPENDHGGRVIVTTRVEDVARQACCNHRQCIYKMKPLSEEHSKKLFSNRVFGSQDCHPSQFEEVSAQILKKCGGLPLAIITIASILANRPAISRKDWESITDSLGSQFAINSDLDVMKSILNLSYMHLPVYLRACFLHLGMYPEDQVIKRDDLVRQWIVEGLISNMQGQDLEAVGKSYFNELINRSLILPEGNLPGDVMFCRVHDMMLELILSKCAEYNFMRVAYNYEDMSRLHDYKYKVHRLSLKSNVGKASGGTVSSTASTRLSHVRSFALFGKLSYTPPLLLWKYLRVLVFETTGAIDLTEISQLFQLRYLKVSASSDVKLPAEMKGLLRLETLDIYCIYLQYIPPDVVHLPLLTHLAASKYTRLPDGIRNMKSLRTLHGFNPWKRLPKEVDGLGELTNLRDLRLNKANGRDLATTELAALVSSIGKLCNLKSLRIGGWTEDVDDRLGSLSNPPAQIEVLRLGKWLFSRVPKWIGGLHCLCHLYLLVRETSTKEVGVLGELPSLVHLSLWVEHIPKHSALVLGAGLFPVLEDLKFHVADGDVTKYLTFEAGAIPKLRRLTLQFHEQDWGGATPTGLEHLLTLEQIHVYIRSRIEDREQVRRDAEYAFRSATRAHPSCPSFTIGG